MGLIKSDVNVPKLWGIELEITYWSDNSQSVQVSNPMLDPNFVQNTLAKPKLWGVDFELTHWDDNSQPVQIVNPMLDPNFVQDTVVKPKLWGVELTPIISGEKVVDNVSNSTSFEELGNYFGSTISYPLVISRSSQVTVSSTSYISVLREIIFVPGVKKRFCVNAEIWLNNVGVSTGATLKLQINSNDVWVLEPGVIDNSPRLIQSGARIIHNTSILVPNSVWTIELFMKSEANRIANIRGIEITLF